ncbi:DUF6326 family protein [Maribacter sp. 2210JD10-5]|uniref:DUF6326 family protein n=1 Tax=Maribacter sp. 2210JD10-5 TaxID=3386272 RepID=UPI0039BCDB9B
MTISNVKNTLSILWIFLSVNYLFCDVFSLYLSESLKQLLTGEMDGIAFTQEFLLTFAIIMEIPLLMIVLSSLLHYKWNRILNIAVGILMIIVQIGSLVTGKNTLHYLFFSSIEIIALTSIVFISWKWKN